MAGYQRAPGTYFFLAFVAVALAAYYAQVLHPPHDNKEFRTRYGPTACIAGASEGMGFAWAEYFAARGLNVIMIARHKEPLEKAAANLRKAYGAKVETRVFDLASDGVVDFAEQLFKENSNIGTLIYNAAYTGATKGYFTSDTLEMAHTAVDVNVKGVLSLVHPFLKARQGLLRNIAKRDQMAGHSMPDSASGGGLVLMSSMAGLVGSAHISTYAATKAWDTAFAVGLYEELRGGNSASPGIDVLSCIAGATTTPNYLKRALKTRSRKIEQPPDEVVAECAASLGVRPTCATGWVNWFGQFSMMRLVPTWAAVRIMSDGTRTTTKLDDVPQKA